MQQAAEAASAAQQAAEVCSTLSDLARGWRTRLAPRHERQGLMLQAARFVDRAIRISSLPELDSDAQSSLAQ